MLHSPALSHAPKLSSCVLDISNVDAALEAFSKEVTCNCMGVHALESRISHPFSPPVLQVTDVKRAVKSATNFFRQCKQQKKPEEPFPLLVVDEANFMQDWQSESERKVILAFLVNVSVWGRTRDPLSVHTLFGRVFP